MRAKRAIVTLPPTLAGRIRYVPALPAARDHLTESTPMGWVIKVHCVYPTRFWRDQNLSGAVTSDEGGVRATADNSPPSGSPAILLGFIEGAAARDLASAPRAKRRAAVLAGTRLPGMERQDGRCSALRRARRPGSTGGPGLSRKELEEPRYVETAKGGPCTPNKLTPISGSPFPRVPACVPAPSKYCNCVPIDQGGCKPS